MTLDLSSLFHTTIGFDDIARILNKNHGWLQYSVDYIIGSEYMKASIEKSLVQS